MNASDLQTLVIQILMAAAGAIARLLNRGGAAQLKILTVLSEVFIAGFTALILYWIMNSSNINRGYMFAAAGISGWVGPKIINVLANAVASKSGIDLSIKPEDKSDNNNTDDTKIDSTEISK